MIYNVSYLYFLVTYSLISTVFVTYVFRHESALFTSKLILVQVLISYICYLLVSKNKNNRNSFPSHFSIKQVTFLFVAAVLCILQIFYQADVWSLYYPLSPLKNLLNGDLLHHDSIFHLSIVGSISEVGFPSIAQDGYIFTAYHVLSHYVDALIVTTFSLNKLSSYGALFVVKCLAFIFVITSLYFRTIYKSNNIGFLLVYFSIFCVPLVITSWHHIASHGLWVPSFIILIFIPTVLDYILEEEKTFRFYLILTLIIFLVSLGKVSSGFSLAVFIGFFALLKRPRCIKLYIFGTIWLGFFVIQNELLSGFSKFGVEKDPTELVQFYKLFTETKKITDINFFYLSLSIIVSSFLISLTSKNKDFLRLSLSSFATIGVISILSTSFFGLNRSDITYFFIGLCTASTVSLVYLSMRYAQSYIQSEHNSKSSLILTLTFLAALSIYSSSKYNNFSVLNVWNVKEVIENSRYTNPANEYSRHKSDLETINVSELEHAIKSKALMGVDYIVFLDDSQLTDLSHRLNISPWSIGQLIHVISTYPLANAVQTNMNRYGYADYGKNSNSLEFSESNFQYTCQKFGKDILYFLDDNFLDWKIYPCVK